MLFLENKVILFVVLKRGGFKMHAVSVGVFIKENILDIER